MPPGIDLAGVTGWFEAEVAGARPPLRVAQGVAAAVRQAASE